MTANNSVIYVRLGVSTGTNEGPTTWGPWDPDPVCLGSLAWWEQFLFPPHYPFVESEEVTP